MKRCVLSLALISSVACKGKEPTKAPDPVPEPAPAVVADAATPVTEPYRMKKGGDSELVKLDPLPAGWEREDGDSGTVTHVVKDPSLPDGKLEVEVTFEQLRKDGMKKPADWGAAEVDFMKAKITKTETIGKATVFHFKADREWYWAYAELDTMLWRCGGDLFTDQKLAAVQDAVAVGRKLCASMTR